MAKAKRKARVGADCVACGNCVRYCPVQAITICKGLYALVEEEKCIGCGRCSNACPAGVIEMVAKEISA